MLRGGAFKPRTSPYSFQGLGKEGIDLLIQARKITGLPIVTEIMDLSDLDCFGDVDVVQVGARNMQNFTLLKAPAEATSLFFSREDFSSTLQELLMSAEYIMSEGNQNVILCERGIRNIRACHKKYSRSFQPFLCSSRKHTFLSLSTLASYRYRFTC